MTVATLVHSNIVRSRSFGSESYSTRKTKKCLACVMVFAIFVSGFLYVLETNNLASKNYKISELNEKIEELETTNKSLQIEVSNLKSINILQVNSDSIEMVKAPKIDYVSLPKSSAMLAK